MIDDASDCPNLIFVGLRDALSMWFENKTIKAVGLVLWWKLILGLL